MIRVGGTMVYEAPAFHDLCDELGLLVWQDFMFANLDYPSSEHSFRELARVAIRQALAGRAGRPSLAVLWGNSELDQQVGMLGLDSTLARSDLFDRLIPELIAETEVA